MPSLSDRSPWVTSTAGNLALHIGQTWGRILRSSAAETEVDDLGKKIFQMAADKSPTVITKSPQPNNSCQIINKTFDDIITASIER